MLFLPPGKGVPGGPADARTALFPSPPLSCLRLMSRKCKVVPWQLALDSLPELVRFQKKWSFPLLSRALSAVQRSVSTISHCC